MLIITLMLTTLVLIIQIKQLHCRTESISNKYNDKVNSNTIDKTNKEEVVKQNDILKHITKRSLDLIALDKNELSKTKMLQKEKKLNRN